MRLLPILLIISAFSSSAIGQVRGNYRFYGFNYKPEIVRTATMAFPETDDISELALPCNSDSIEEVYFPQSQNFCFNKEGYLDSLVFLDNGAAHYMYDSNNQLIEEVHYRQKRNRNYQLEKTRYVHGKTTYTYDSMGRVILIDKYTISGSKLIKYQSYETRYDEKGRMVYRAPIDISGNPEPTYYQHYVIDGLFVMRGYKDYEGGCDTLGSISKKIGFPILSYYQESGNYISNEYVYNSLDRIVEHKYYRNDSLQYTKTNSYSEAGLSRVVITDANGKSSEYIRNKYNAAGLLVETKTTDVPPYFFGAYHMQMAYYSNGDICARMTINKEWRNALTLFMYEKY